MSTGDESYNAFDMNKQVDVHILGDAVLFVEAVATLLSKETWASSISVATSPTGLMRRSDSALPSVLLINCCTERRPSWIRSAAERLPGTPVVALGVAGTEDEVLRSAEAGAASFFFLDQSISELGRTVLAAVMGEVICPPSVTAALVRCVGRMAGQVRKPTQVDELTERELEVLALIAAGRANKEIAAELAIGLCTVKNHVHNVLRKLNVERRGEAAALLLSP